MSSDATVLFVSQVYPPDPASVGQHISDAAEELVRRGCRVVVLTSRRGYDDPTRVYATREKRNGVEVIRLPFSSFGKSRLVTRIVGGLLFICLATLRATVFRATRIVSTTSPPMGGLAALLIRSLTGASFVHWIMDVNPDQAVAAGKARPDSLPVRLFDCLNRNILSRATDVVVLDRYMAERVRSKGRISGNLHILPPWPLEQVEKEIPHSENQWRSNFIKHGSIAIVYSGNHSPSNPLTTILKVAERLQDLSRIQFYFVGGGLGKLEVENSSLSNVHSLPYQPYDQIKYSLSAADIHVVSMGNDVVGIVHPCKIYGAMAVARPVLALGPRNSHVGELVVESQIGWLINHGDLDELENLLRELAGLTDDELARLLREKGLRAQSMIQETLGREALRAKFCDIVFRSEVKPDFRGIEP